MVTIELANIFAKLKKDDAIRVPPEEQPPKKKKARRSPCWSSSVWFLW